MIEAKANERITQTEAARHLGVTLTALNNIIRREGIYWPVIRRGFKSRTDEEIRGEPK